MMETRSRSGSVTAANAETNLRNIGGTTNTSQPTIPAGVTRIKKVRATGITAGGDGSATLWCGVNGTGINAAEKPVRWPISGFVAATAAGLGEGPVALELDVDVSVTPNQEFDIVGGMFGDDMTDADIDVSLEFE